MDWLHLMLNALLGGLFGFCMIKFVEWVRKPKPVDRNEIPRLRKEALRILDECGRSDFNKGWEQTTIASERRVDNLRVYARFIGEYRVVEISSLISWMRINRTKMKPEELTAEHMRFYSQFMEAERHHVLGHSGVQSATAWKKERTSVYKPMFYAFEHMDDSAMILSIVRDRGIFDIREIKSLLADMKSSGGVLSDGAL